jgi:hypothetical protein
MGYTGKDKNPGRDFPNPIHLTHKSGKNITHETSNKMEMEHSSVHIIAGASFEFMRFKWQFKASIEKDIIHRKQLHRLQQRLGLSTPEIRP